jgi:DNA mismatch endonuclease (patch repair protein)
MSRASSGKNTDLELALFSILRKNQIRFRRHVGTLPGKPDAALSKFRIAIFVDGDFWHGYRLPEWEGALSDFWKIKISRNRARDKRNFAALRRLGWQVIRIWGHQIKNAPDSVTRRIDAAVKSAKISAARASTPTRQVPHSSGVRSRKGG